MKKYFYIPLFVLLVSTKATAQVIPRITDRPIRLQPSSQGDVVGFFVVGEVKGTVPSNAVFLPKPEYPSEARWKGIEGTIRIAVEIDKEGNVERSAAVAGPEQLRGSSEDAARRSKFRIARNDANEPVGASGELVYTYQIRKASWVVIGWGLTSLESLPSSTLPLPAIRKALDAEWYAEHELVDKLDNIRGKEPPKLPPTIVRSAPMTIPDPSGRGSRTVMRGQLHIPDPPSDELKIVAAQLLSDVRGRLSGDPLASWQLELGTKLRGLIDAYRNPNTRTQAVTSIRKIIRSAPSSGAEKTVQYLRETEALFTAAKDARAMNDLARLISEILAGN